MCWERLQEAAAGAGLFLLLEGPACLPGSLCIPNLLPRKGVPKAALMLQILAACIPEG